MSLRYGFLLLAIALGGIAAGCDEDEHHEHWRHDDRHVMRDDRGTNYDNRVYAPADRPDYRGDYQGDYNRR